MDINSVILTGRLTKDVELKYTQNNTAVVMFDIAVGNGKDKDGNERKANFLRINCWEKQAENVAKFCKKGSQIAVDGSIKTDSYETEKGEKKYRTYILAKRIMFLGSKKEEEPMPEEPDYLRNQESVGNQETDPFQEFGEQYSLDDMPF